MKNTYGLDDAVIPIYYPSGLVRWLEEQGYERAALIDGTGLEASAIDVPDVRVSFRQHRTLICNALDITGNQHLGLYFGLQLKITAMGMVGYAAMSSDTLQGALDALLQFHTLRAPLIRLRMEELGGVVHLRFDEALDYGPIRLFMLEGIVGASTSLLNSMGMGPLEGTEFRLSVPRPDDFENHQHLLSMPVVFDQPVTEWLFPVEYLAHKSDLADPVTAASTRDICEAELKRLGSQEGLVDRVERLLALTPGQYPALSDIALELCASPRTLRRELAKLGVTYQVLLDQHRSKLALQYLKTTNLSRPCRSTTWPIPRRAIAPSEG